MEQDVIEGENPVWRGVRFFVKCLRRVELFGNAALTGGKLHLRLNIAGRPIANKYSDGKMKRTLKRE